MNDIPITQPSDIQTLTGTHIDFPAKSSFLFQDQTGDTIYTYTGDYFYIDLYEAIVSHWPELIFLATLILSFIFIKRFLSKRKQRKLNPHMQTCPRCDYLISEDKASTCTECGHDLATAFSKPFRRTRNFTRRTFKLTTILLCLLTIPILSILYYHQFKLTHAIINNKMTIISSKNTELINNIRLPKFLNLFNWHIQLTGRINRQTLFPSDTSSLRFLITHNLISATKWRIKNIQLNLNDLSTHVQNNRDISDHTNNYVFDQFVLPLTSEHEKTLTSDLAYFDYDEETETSFITGKNLADLNRGWPNLDHEYYYYKRLATRLGNARNLSTASYIPENKDDFLKPQHIGTDIGEILQLTQELDYQIIDDNHRILIAASQPHKGPFKLKQRAKKVKAKSPDTKEATNSDTNNDGHVTMDEFVDNFYGFDSMDSNSGPNIYDLSDVGITVLMQIEPEQANIAIYDAEDLKTHRLLPLYIDPEEERNKPDIFEGTYFSRKNRPTYNPLTKHWLTPDRNAINPENKLPASHIGFIPGTRIGFYIGPKNITNQAYIQGLDNQTYTFQYIHFPSDPKTSPHLIILEDNKPIAKLEVKNHHPFDIFLDQLNHRAYLIIRNGTTTKIATYDLPQLTTTSSKQDHITVNGRTIPLNELSPGYPEPWPQLTDPKLKNDIANDQQEDDK
ncbi:hypothetical protein JD969_11730 [Planctomycetota bacterium]|nr:hypothetical protein JD969_11730 [Planctomycetota bacterium]